MNSIFRAYDVRGVYPSELNEDIVTRILSTPLFHGGAVVVGHDARVSSPTLYRAARVSLTSRGALVIPVGLITTPMLYFLVNNLKAAGGVMITASHNPKEYNGLKIVREGAVPISGKEVEQLLPRVTP